MPDGTEPVAEDEKLYRRVHVGAGYFKPDRIPPLSDKAFKPTPKDVDGISFTRAGYVANPAEAARGGYQGKSYFIIEMRAGDLAGIGLTLKPDPLPTEKGHMIVPEINCRDFNSTGGADTVLTAMNSARNLPYTWHGPFPGSKPPPR